MSKLSDDIKKYVQGDYLTGEEYGKWGCLNRTQRKDINKLCELCDMFEKSADNFYKENLQKDQRIAELEREKQTAVKEFACYIINNILPKDLCGLNNYQSKISNGIRRYLKERGIE